MKQFFYGDLKSDDVKNNIEVLKQLNITDYVIDFDTDETVTSLLLANRIHSYYRIKLYDIDINNINYQEIESHIVKAKAQGFYGFAIDAEAYSNSKIWESNGDVAFNFGKKLGQLVQKYFKDLVIYPENLGGTKYGSYMMWFNGLLTTQNLNIILLLERTYEIWKPWEIISIYNRAVKEQGVETYIGIWYESMSDFKFISEPINKNLEKAIEDGNKAEIEKWQKNKKIFDASLPYRKIICTPCQVVQWIVTKLYNKRFYYTETKDILKNTWYQWLSK